MISLDSAFLGFALVNGINYAMLAWKYFAINSSTYINNNNYNNMGLNFPYNFGYQSNYNSNYLRTPNLNNNDHVLLGFCSVSELLSKS